MKLTSAGEVRRILMSTDTIGGVWNYALELCRELSGAGIEIALASMGEFARPDQMAEAERIPGLSLYQSDYALEWMDHPWEDAARAAEWLWELEQELRPDLIHLNNFAQGALPWTAPVVMVGHSCVLSWWKSVKREAAPACWDRYIEVVRQGLHAADVVVAPSLWMADQLMEFYQLEEKPWVIFNGRNGSHYHPGPKEEFVLSVGRLWDEAKNLRMLGSIASNFPWPVKVAGSLRSPGGATQVLGNIETVGILSETDIAGWMAKAAVYVLPAKYEPYGLSILEAALSKCALVLGDIPSLRELWNDAAVFVSPEDPAALRGVCMDLARDRDRRERLGREAYARAQEFTSARMGGSYRDLYNQLVETKRNAKVGAKYL